MVDFAREPTGTTNCFPFRSFLGGFPKTDALIWRNPHLSQRPCLCGFWLEPMGQADFRKFWKFRSASAYERNLGGTWGTRLPTREFSRVLRTVTTYSGALVERAFSLSFKSVPSPLATVVRSAQQVRKAALVYHGFGAHPSAGFLL